MMDCKSKKWFQESPLGLGAQPCWGPPAHHGKTLEQKDHLLEEERGGGGMGG